MRIIAGFAGVGKTTFCNNNENAIDFIREPFEYENYIELLNKYGKNLLEVYTRLQKRDDWMFFYYDVLRSIYCLYQDEIIVIPTIFPILYWLEKDDIPFTLVYPSVELKEEYRQRYIESRSLEGFISILNDNWDYKMQKIRWYKNAECIELGPGQYLSDVIQCTKYEKHNIIGGKDEFIFKIVSGEQDVLQNNLKSICRRNLDI